MSPPMTDPTHTATVPEALASRCSQCGAAFVCGYVAGLSTCWCAQEPFLPASGLVPDQLCLCPDCLRDRKATLANRPDECHNHTKLT